MLNTVLYLKQGYEMAYEGDVVVRVGDENNRMTVESSKPVLVSLRIDDSDSGSVWNSMIIVPPIEQYTTRHTFPGMAGFEWVSSVAVDRVSSKY